MGPPPSELRAVQVSFKGFGLAESDLKKGSDFMYKGQKYTLSQGSVVIAAITSPQTLRVKSGDSRRGR